MRYSGIGGQAVMEGVMMRNGDKYAVAVRKPDKEIAIEVKDAGTTDDIWHKLPIIRGVVAFVESLVIGLSTLMLSASYFEDEEESKKDMTKEEQAKKEKMEVVKQA